MERPDTYNTSRLVDGYRQAFVDSETEAEPDFTPRFVSNSNGTTVKSVIENELKDCSSMFMSVAFITSGGIAPFLGFLKELEWSFRVSFSTARMTTMQRSSVTMAASTSPRATLPMDWFKMEVKSDITGKSSFQETKCKEIIPETGEKVNVSGKSGCGPERQLI